MPPLVHDDVTVTLDELFANNKVADLVPSFTPAWKKVSAGSSKNINAKGAFYMLRTKGPNYIKSKAFGNTPGAAFPEATKSKYMVMSLTAIEDTATISWDGNVDVQNKAALKQKPAKELDYVEMEMASIYEAYGRDKSRQLWDNRGNELARVSATDTVNHLITFNNAGNLFDAQLLEEGDLLEIRDGAGTLRCYVEVLILNRAAKQIKVNPDNIRNTAGALIAAIPGSVVNNDRVYPKDGYNNGWAGFEYLTDVNGGFQSLNDRTIHDHLVGERFDATGRTLSSALLRRLLSGTRFRRYGKKSKGKFYASTQIDAFESTGLATQRYGQTKTLEMGYEDDDLKFGGKSFEWDFYVKRNVVNHADLDAIDKFNLREFMPIRHEGGYKSQAPTEGTHYDRTNIYFKGIGNLGCEVPAAVGGQLYNLSTAGLATGS